MGKGILLEMAGRQAVVLTPQGEFKKVPVPGGNWEIGDEIEFAEVRQQPAWLRWGSAAAAAAVLFIGSYTGVNIYRLAQPVAIVTVDINPSLELTLNVKDQVLKAQPLNADGELVLKGVDYKRQPLDAVLVALTDRAVEEQKLDPADETSTVLVGVAPAKERELPSAQVERVVEKAKAAVTNEVAKVASAKGQEVKTNVAVLAASTEEKREAEQEGLPVGKYMLLQSVRDLAPDVTAEEMKKSGPGKLLREHNISPAEVFSNAEKKNDQGKEKKSEKEDVKDQPVSAGPGANSNSGDKQEKPPAKGDDKNPGKGGKQDEPEQNGQGAGQSDKPGDGGGKQPDEKKAEADSKNGSDQKNGNGNSKKEEPKKEEPKKENGNSGSPKKDEGKKDAWTIPWLGISIEKPAFLRDKDREKAAEAEEAPATETPRAEAPGVAAPSVNGEGRHPELEPTEQEPEEKQHSEEKKSEEKQSEGKKSEEKQSEGKKSEEKQSEEKKSEEKQSEEKKSEEKKSEEKKSEEKQSEEKRSEEKQSEEKQSEEKQSEEKKRDESKPEKDQKGPSGDEESKSNDSKQDEKKETEKQNGKDRGEDPEKENEKDK